MRTIKELLIILRDNLKVYNEHTGLCAFTYKLTNDGIISSKEYFMIMKYLDDNIPNTFNVIVARILDWEFKKPVVSHWWDYGKKKPRIKWLNKQIDKL